MKRRDRQGLNRNISRPARRDESRRRRDERESALRVVSSATSLRWNPRGQSARNLFSINGFAATGRPMVSGESPCHAGPGRMSTHGVAQATVPVSMGGRRPKRMKTHDVLMLVFSMGCEGVFGAAAFGRLRTRLGEEAVRNGR